MKTSYRVGGVLVLCYLVAWLDRMAINMTIQDMAKDLNIGPERIGWILSAFFAGYALFQIPGGMLADRVGARLVILCALAWWSVFTGFTGLASTFGMMLAVRFFFGVGEGIFPAAVWKVIGSWFTKKNRASANALIISSIALGPALTPLILAPVLGKYGWRTCFYVLGLLGAVCWVVCHRMVYNSIREHPRSSPEEIEEYEADQKSETANREATLQKASFGDLLKTPIVWVLFSIGLVCNIAMYGWLNWLPSYLLREKNLDLKSMAFAASIPFMFGAIGCMSAGFISDRWFRGRRKLLVLICMGTGLLSLFLFTRVSDMTTAMVMQCVAGLSLFMASGALWALPMIFLPPALMGSGSGFINT
ncbi:MAG TPA: MFS transporter, partial [Candidatus Ozemobacteraceae bacterium]|nr:MFS transporter [Candidatus Ozemobacteraceae bacterium]